MGNVCATTNNIKVHISMRIWNQKSYGLFDFSNNSNQMEQKDIYLTKDNRIVLNVKKDIVTFVKEEDLESIDFNKLSPSLRIMAFDLGNKNIRINKIGKSISDSFWRSIYHSQEEIIHENDFIRMGKIILKLKTLKCLNESKKTDFKNLKNKFIINKKSKLAKNQIQIVINNFKNKKKIYTRLKNQDKNQCRVCYEDDSEEDPFLELCKCSNNNPIHLSCLKKWMQKKGKKKSNIFHYESKEIKCELCQEIYPMTVNYKNNDIFLFSTEIDETKNFALFEIFDKKLNQLKGMIFIYLEKNKKISFGRAEQNDIVFDDISVSRIHSFIILKKNKLYLQDVNSKFGTHILFNKTIFPKQNRNIRFQMDKYLFIVHFFENKSCYCFSKKNKYHYVINPFKPLTINNYISDSSVIERSSNSKKNKVLEEKILEVENESPKIDSNLSFFFEDSLKSNKYDINNFSKEDNLSIHSLMKLIEKFDKGNYEKLSKSNLNQLITPLKKIRSQLKKNDHRKQSNYEKSILEREKLIKLFLNNKNDKSYKKDGNSIFNDENSKLDFKSSEDLQNFKFK